MTSNSEDQAPPVGHRLVAIEDSGDALMTPGNTAVSIAVGLVRVLLSAALLLAIPVSLVGLYLAYLAFIPPCYDPGVAWYNCPPDPATTVGLGLIGVAVPLAAIAGVVALWAPRFRRRWGGWVLLVVADLSLGMWLILSAIP